MPVPPAWYAGQRFTAAELEEITPQVWQPLSLLNGWTNRAGQVAAQIRQRDLVTVDVVGTISAGTVAASTALFNLPAGLGPASNQVVTATEWFSANGLAPLVVQSGGGANVILLTALTAGAALSFAFSYWLDC